MKTPEPIPVAAAELLNEVDLCCFTQLKDGKIFDTINTSFGTYGFCSSFCKERYKKNLPMECKDEY